VNATASGGEPLPDRPLFKRIVGNWDSLLRTLGQGQRQEHSEQLADCLSGAVEKLCKRYDEDPRGLDSIELGWVVVVARRDFVRWLKGPGKDRPDAEPLFIFGADPLTQSAPASEEQAIGAIERADSMEALNQIPELGTMHRRILRMRLKGHSYEDIAVELSRASSRSWSAGEIFRRVQLIRKAIPEAGAVLDDYVEEPPREPRIAWWAEVVSARTDAAPMSQLEREIMARHLGGMTDAEIAVEVDRAPGRVSNILSELRKKYPWLSTWEHPSPGSALSDPGNADLDGEGEDHERET